jgi:hypothetical protein
MHTKLFVLSTLLISAAASSALAESTVYPATICVPANDGTEVEIPFTRGGVRLVTDGTLFCPIVKTSTAMVVRNVYVRIRRGASLAEIMLTIWAFDGFGNASGSAQGHFFDDHRNQSRSYTLPIAAAGLTAPATGYYLIDLMLNRGDELISIRVDE